MQITTPDIGVDKAIVSEILVNIGDVITENDSIIVLESDKASVEVPSPTSGKVTAILVKLGDEVQEGAVLLEVEATEQDVAATQATEISSQSDNKPSQENTPEKVEDQPTNIDQESNTVAQEIEVKVPDIGVEKAIVSEILVKVGDQIDSDESLIVVESDKASVEIPSPIAGEISSISVKSGDVVKEGVILLTVKTVATASTTTQAATKEAAPNPQPKTESVHQQTAPVTTKNEAQTSPTQTDAKVQLTEQQLADNSKVYAGPAVRQLARELGVVLGEVKATGTNGRLVKDDVFAYVKTRLSAPSVSTPSAAPAVASGLPALPDFSAFGGGELKAMTRLQQVSVPQLSLNNFIPQVTQFDLADITALEAWRGELKEGFKKQGIGLTILAFIAKATAHLLREEPYFFGHLADDQKAVLLRNEIHMGIAVATPDGLTVPVLRNPDQKSIKQIAQELAELSQKARDKKLSPKDLQGANFTITSLGSIGGTAFTPLVNWPQVAILGISPATMQPVWNGKDFDPRLMLPLSLSYDHRVINGADAARFTHKLTLLLKDIRNILL